MENLRTVDEAKSLLRNSIRLPREVEKINLGDSLRRVVFSDIVAPQSSPMQPRSAMDGIAVKSNEILNATDDNRIELRVSGEIGIGEPPVEFEGDKICVKIPTGGGVPENFDAVVPVEYVDFHEDRAIVRKYFEQGSNIDPVGSDYKQGEILLRKGILVRSKDVSAIASLGLSDVDVVKKVKVGIAPTGDELMPAGYMPTPSKVYDSNGWGIKAALEETNQFSVRHYGIMRDNQEEISLTIRKMLMENDIVVTSGGTSAGEKDLVSKVLSEMDPGIIFHGLKTKPGMPTLFSMSENKPVIGLPGPPVSAMMVLYEVFIPILLEKLELHGLRIRLKAKLSAGVRLSKNKTNLVPVSLTGNDELIAEPLMGASGAVSRLSRAEGYFVQDGGLIDSLDSGTEVMVVPFSVLPM